MLNRAGGLLDFIKMLGFDNSVAFRFPSIDAKLWLLESQEVFTISSFS